MIIKKILLIFLPLLLALAVITTGCNEAEAIENNNNDDDVPFEYIPMLLPENQWNEFVENSSIPREYKFYNTYISKIGNDTLINGVNYYKLLTTKDEFSSIWLNNGYIREEIENGKVYYKPENELEILLYDFSAQVGDVIESWDMLSKEKVLLRVDSVNNILIGSKTRKQIIVSINYNQNYWFGEYVWIEGFGNLSGVFRSTGTARKDGIDQITLLCFFQNSDLVYKPENRRFDDCFVWQNPQQN